MAFAKPASYEHLTGRGPVLNLLQPLLRRNSTTAVRHADDWGGAGSGLAASGGEYSTADIQVGVGIVVT